MIIPKEQMFNLSMLQENKLDDILNSNNSADLQNLFGRRFKRLRRKLKRKSKKFWKAHGNKVKLAAGVAGALGAAYVGHKMIQGANAGGPGQTP